MRFVLRNGWVGNRAGNARELANVAVRPDDGGRCFVFLVLAQGKTSHACSLTNREFCEWRRAVRGTHRAACPPDGRQAARDKVSNVRQGRDRQNERASESRQQK